MSRGLADSFLRYNHGKWIDCDGDPVEIELVVHAHWEFLNDYQSRCSHCHSEVFVDHNDEPPYCERCGAHMDEEVAGDG